MSLSKEALIRIEELVASSLDAPETYYDKIILPSGVVVGDLERFQDKRNQFRGKMKTESIEDFVEYCNEQAEGVCFINREDMCASAIFDIGDTEKPGHCLHSAFIELKQTSAFTEMKVNSNKRLTQQELAEFIEDWKDDAVLSDDESVITINKAIAAIRKITIKASSDSEHNVKGFSASTSTMDKLDASSGEENIPGYMVFTCKPYHGLIEYDFKLRISLIVTGGEPLFILRPVKLEEKLEKISEEFRSLVTTDMHKDIGTYMGFFDSNVRFK